MQLGSRALSLPASGIRQVMELSRGMSGVIHLEVGEPDFATPEHVVRAAHEAATAGFTKYTPNAGLPGIREAVAARYVERLGKHVTPEWVVVTPGAVAAVATTFFALLDPGDEVLIPDPGWPNYTSAALLTGARPVPYPLASESGGPFEIDFDELPRRITSRTRAMVVNSPSNPTGAVFTPDAHQALVTFAAHHGLFVISDEVYEDLVYDGVHVSPARFDEDGRVVVVSGVSKSYAMTGWRIGYVIAPPTIAALVTKLQEPLVSCASAVSQMAAEAALRGPQACVREMVTAYRARRDAVVTALTPDHLLAGRPTGAFYALVRVPRQAEGTAFALSLLRDAHVAVAPGPTFGTVAGGLMRISFATETSLLQEGLRRIRAYLEAFPT
jgi:aspartate/methionine/tyrosine aminotransferase